MRWQFTQQKLNVGACLNVKLNKTQGRSQSAKEKASLSCYFQIHGSTSNPKILIQNLTNNSTWYKKYELVPGFFGLPCAAYV